MTTKTTTMTMTSTKSSSFLARLFALLGKRSLVWLYVWLPALGYFLATRAPHLGGHGNAAATVTADRFQLYQEQDCAVVKDRVLYSNTPCADDDSSSFASTATRLVLSQPLQLLWNAEDEKITINHHDKKKTTPVHFVDTAWYHDVDTAAHRGAILISDAASNGRVWRWETGGGPIAIGRTLVLDDAGCRSNVGAMVCSNNNKNDETTGNDDELYPYRGAGGLGTVLPASSSSDAGSTLYVAEWGEGRIVRMEQETGARTPLVLQVPTTTTSAITSATTTTTTTTTEPENANTTATITAAEPSCRPYTNSSRRRRIQTPRHLHVTPQQGDLLFLEGGTVAKALGLPPDLQPKPWSSSSSSSSSTTTTTTDQEECAPEDDTCTTSLAIHSRSTLWWRRGNIHTDIAPLPSLPVSRHAHAWDSLPWETNSRNHNDDDIQDDGTNNFSASATTTTTTSNNFNLSNFYVALFSGESLGSFDVVEEQAADNKYSSITTTTIKVYLTAMLPRAGGVVILEILLPNNEIDEDEDEEDDDDELENRQKEKETSTSPPFIEPRIVFRLKRYMPTAMEPGPLVVAGDTIFLATNEGIAILLANNNNNNHHGDDSKTKDTSGDAYHFVGLLPLPIMDRPRITSMTLGADKYLYVSTESRLWRIKVKL